MNIVSVLQNGLDKLNTKIETIQSKIETIQSKLTPLLNEKKIIEQTLNNLNSISPSNINSFAKTVTVESNNELSFSEIIRKYSQSRESFQTKDVIEFVRIAYPERLEKFKSQVYPSLLFLINGNELVKVGMGREAIYKKMPNETTIN